jgi:hypothetical protein
VTVGSVICIAAPFFGRYASLHETVLSKQTVTSGSVEGSVLAGRCG